MGKLVVCERIPPGYYEETCPCCGHVQLEAKRHKPDDKYAWECDRCQTLIEGGKPHLFETIPGYVKTRKGCSCCSRGSPNFIPEEDLKHFYKWRRWSEERA